MYMALNIHCFVSRSVTLKSFKFVDSNVRVSGKIIYSWIFYYSHDITVMLLKVALNTITLTPALVSTYIYGSKYSLKF